MALRRLIIAAAAAWAIGSAPGAWTSEQDPNFGHGVGKVIGGLIFEWPKTVVDATLTGPPVVGTLVGVLAGTARAVQTVVAGVVEMGAGFDPWGIKRGRRR